MNISDQRRPWIPSYATDIRRTRTQFDADDDWKCRLEGAREVMRKLTPALFNVTTIKRKVK